MLKKAAHRRIRLQADRALIGVIGGLRRTGARQQFGRLKATPAAWVGDVEAADADSAIREAIKVYRVTNPEHQKARGAPHQLTSHGTISGRYSFSYQPQRRKCAS
jgi:hypothetical protein